MPRLPTAALLIGFLSCLQDSHASTNIYMQVTGIPGTSSDVDRQNWIDITEVSFSAENAGGKPSLEGIGVTKPVDAASPALMKLMRDGLTVDQVKFHHTKNDPSTGLRYVHFEAILKAAFFTSVEQADSLGNSPMEILSLHPERIDWFIRRPDGRLETSVFYDVILGISGPTSLGPFLEQPADASLSAGAGTTRALRISDPDDPISSLSVSALSSNPDLVPHPTPAFDGSGWILPLSTDPTGKGTVSIEIRVSDGPNNTTKSFVVNVDDTGTPWGNFLDAYFSEIEQADPAISSPIEDPDDDDLPTVLEFLLGSNPRDFTPQSEVLTFEPFEAANGETHLRFLFKRRIDAPGIQLGILRSTDGVEWSLMRSGSGNPLYTESGNVSQNPIFEDVEGIVEPPDTGSWRFLFQLQGTW